MTRKYCGNYFYRNGAIERILMGNGFMQDSAYYVQVKDYQGNVRTVLDHNGMVVERNSYYPYGGLINANESTFQPYKYSSKELDRENGLDLYDSQARWYDPMLPCTTTQDPLAEKYYPISPYTWCAGNPVSIIDPDGEEWKDINGNVISDHRNIKEYIFYDPKSFLYQSLKMYRNAESQYGKGSVALSDVTTAKDFAQDWKDMRSKIIKEVNLNYHGNNQTVFLDAMNNEYITATGDGQTSKSEIDATNVQDLPQPIGDISKAQLNLNTCKSNSTTQYPLKGNGKTLMRTFKDEFKFERVRGSSVGVSYGRLDGMPHPKYFSSKGWFKDWEYMGKPIIKSSKVINDNIPLYYKTGGTR